MNAFSNSFLVEVRENRPINSSRERRTRVIAHRKTGNFILNSEKNEMVPVPNLQNFNNIEQEYSVCTCCACYKKNVFE